MKIRSCLITVVFFICSAFAHADEYSTLKDAIQSRAPAVHEMKASGNVREGLNGLLEAGGTLNSAEKFLLASENSDRTKMFQLIGTRTGKSAEEVGKAFASGARAAQPVPPKPAAQSPQEKPETTVPPVSPRPPLPASSSEASSKQPSPAQEVPSSGSTGMKTKVLTRPFASMFASDDGAASKVSENIPAFTIYYVYQKKGQWYQVGRDNRGKVDGWMKESDVVEWKQNLIVEFTHPDGRDPILMFYKRETVDRLASTSRTSRADQLDVFYKAIAQGKTGGDFPVLAMEPKRAVQRKDQFYILPIVDWKEIEVDGREGRLLQLAATSRKRGATNLQDTSTLDDLNKPTDLTSAAARKTRTDIVFVMDTTRSMGPFAEQTLKMIENFVKIVGGDREVSEALRFGIWGYRDFPELMPGIEYNTYNYTPELQSVSEFAATLRSVKETKIDSIDYEEDVFAGVRDAIQKTAWRQDALRLVILVGDAPGRSPKFRSPDYPNGPVGTKAEMDAPQIRALATENGVSVTSLYLNVPKWRRYLEQASNQFKVLGQNANGLSFKVLNAKDTSVFAGTAEGLAGGIINLQRKAIQGNLTDGDLRTSDAPIETVETPVQGAEAGRQLAANMFRGAIVQLLGKKDAATVTRDVTVWAADKDLRDPSKQALEVKIFLTKEELNSLKVQVDSVMNAGQRNKITGENFFDSLRAVVIVAGKDPSKIRDAANLSSTGLVPEFLKGLPYKSTLMDMSNDTWRNMSPDGQDQLLKGIASKLEFYQNVHDDTSKWEPLNSGDDRDKWVTAIPLETLP